MDTCKLATDKENSYGHGRTSTNQDLITVNLKRIMMTILATMNLKSICLMMKILTQRTSTRMTTQKTKMTIPPLMRTMIRTLLSRNSQSRYIRMPLLTLLGKPMSLRISTMSSTMTRAMGQRISLRLWMMAIMTTMMTIWTWMKDTRLITRVRTSSQTKKMMSLPNIGIRSLESCKE